MSLKQAAEDPSLYTRRLKIKALTPVNLQKAVQMIRSDVEAARNAMDIAALQKQFAEYIAVGALSSLPISALKQAPYGFFDGPVPFADDPTAGVALLNEIARRAHRPSVRLLIYQYLEYFKPQQPGFRRLAEWLQVQVPRWDWSWRMRMERMALFDPDVAPLHLGMDFMASTETIEDRAREAGLSMISLSGGLGAAAFGAACEQVATQKPTALKAAQQRLMQWGIGPNGFIYPAQLPAFVSGLLRPWRDSEPDARHRAALMTALEEIGGDPRVNPARWQRVKAEAPEAYALLLKWLTKASVYQFFDIIDDMIPYEQRHMWAYRRPFWTAYLEAGHIDEAWVVLGANGVLRAQDVVMRTNGKNVQSFGKLIRNYRRTPDQSALVMRIGDVTIVEWSHNGKYQIWENASKSAPNLYRLNYDASELMEAPLADSHNGSETFTWQTRLARDIVRLTGRTTSSNMWRPRR